MQCALFVCKSYMLMEPVPDPFSFPVSHVRNATHNQKMLSSPIIFSWKNKRKNYYNPPPKKPKGKRKPSMFEIVTVLTYEEKWSLSSGLALQGAKLPVLLLRAEDAATAKQSFWGTWCPAGHIPKKKTREMKEVKKDGKAAVSFSTDYVCSLSNLKGKHLYFCRTA